MHLLFQFLTYFGLIENLGVNGNAGFKNDIDFCHTVILLTVTLQ